MTLPTCMIEDPRAEIPEIGHGWGTDGGTSSRAGPSQQPAGSSVLLVSSEGIYCVFGTVTTGLAGPSRVEPGLGMAQLGS